MMSAGVHPPGSPHGRTCLWCNRVFQPRRGGSPKRFCSAAHRMVFWSTLRRWAERAVAAGAVTVDDIRSDDPAPCTLLQGNGWQSPMFNIPAGDTALGAASLTFVVDIERSKVDWLVKFRLLLPEQQEDLLAIMNGLKRLGQPPKISRVSVSDTYRRADVPQLEPPPIRRREVRMVERGSPARPPAWAAPGPISNQGGFKTWNTT